MSQLLTIGISICVLLLVGMIADRLLTDKVAWQDLAWRSTLLAILLLPLLVVSGNVLWPSGLVQVPVLAAHRVSPPNDSLAEKRAFRSGKFDFNFAADLPKRMPTKSSDGDARNVQPRVNSKPTRSSNKQPSIATAEDAVATAPIVVRDTPASLGFSWPALALALAIWLLGSLVFLVRYFAGWWAIRRVIASATKTEPHGWSRAIDRATAIACLESRIVVRASDKITTPMLVGVLRPLVLVPKSMLQFSYSDARVRAALSHEAMHIRRSDPFWNLILFLSLLIWWPIPMVHVMKRRMFWLRELLCDADVAVEMGVADYAESLLRLTQMPKRRPIDQLADSRLLSLPMHSHGQSLESRVAWILELSTSVSNPNRIVRFAISGCLIVALVGFTAIKIVPASSPTLVAIANAGDKKEMKVVGEKLPYGRDAEFEIADEDDQPIAGAKLRNPINTSANYRATTTDMGVNAMTVSDEDDRDEDEDLTLEIRADDVGEEKKFEFPGKDLDRVERVVITANRIPASWWERISSLKKAESLHLQNVELPWSDGKNCQILGHLKKIQFRNCRLTGKQLNLLKDELGGTKLEIIAEHPLFNKQNPTTFDAWDGFEKGKTLSVHDPKAYAKMKAVFDRLHKALDGLVPPATNKFNPPATVAQIAELEHILGMPLHPDYRAYLECHNGQPDHGTSELISCEGLQPIEAVLKEYQMWQAIGLHYRDRSKYRFNPEFMCMCNPNLLPFGSSEDHVLSMNLVTGYVTLHHSESDPEKHAPNIAAYFEKMAAKVEAGFGPDMERQKNGNVKLSRYDD